MKLQLRVQAYNFLNHPLYSFPSGSNLNLSFTQDPVIGSDHADECQLWRYHAETGSPHHGVRSEVLLLTRRDHKTSNGIKPKGFWRTAILVLVENSCRYAEALTSFCFTPILSVASPAQLQAPVSPQQLVQDAMQKQQAGRP